MSHLVKDKSTLSIHSQASNNDTSDGLNDDLQEAPEDTLQINDDDATAKYNTKMSRHHGEKNKGNNMKTTWNAPSSAQQHNQAPQTTHHHQNIPLAHTDMEFADTFGYDEVWDDGTPVFPIHPDHAAPDPNFLARRKEKMMNEERNSSNYGRSTASPPYRAQSYPGAERVGNAAEDGDEDITAQVTVSNPNNNNNNNNSARHRNEEGLVDAVVVDREREELMIAMRLQEEQKKNTPLATAVKDVPWYRRRYTFVIGLLILVIIIVIAVTVPLVDQGGSVGETDSPTTSPAPTSLAVLTVLIQMDEKLHETGWKLSCGGEEVESAPPGTYALLSGARTSFRMEKRLEVTQGDECELVIDDSGGDGIDQGLFQVYYGDQVGDPSLQLLGGWIHPHRTTAKFSVQLPDLSSKTPSPTVVVADEPGGSTSVCTVCPDGTPVPNPFAELTAVGSTCGDMDMLASSYDDVQCKALRDSYAFLCGCDNFCTTICPDGVSEPTPELEDNVVFARDTGPVTCNDFQREIASGLANSQEDCLNANFLGEDVCGCPRSEDFCRICQDKSVPPDMETEIVPGVNCRDITAVAYTIRRASELFSVICPACLAIGAYCGCIQPPPPEGRQFCRLCGNNNEDLLSKAAQRRLVNSTTLGLTTTCYHVEFAANINSNETLPCDMYKQDASDVCCA